MCQAAALAFCEPPSNNTAAFATSAHVAALNEPPAPPSLQDTLPEGADGDPLVSLTVAAKVRGLPGVTEAGLGDRVVVVKCLFTVTCTVPVPVNRPSVSDAV